MKKLHTLAAIAAFSIAAQAQLLMQWKVTLTPDLGNQPVQAVMTWSDYDTVLEVAITYDNTAVAGWTAPLFTTQWEDHQPGWDLTGSPFYGDTSLLHPVPTWIAVLAGAEAQMWDNVATTSAYAATGIWELVLDDRDQYTPPPPVDPPPVDPPPVDPGGGIPEPSTYALISALGLLGFAARRRFIR